MFPPESNLMNMARIVQAECIYDYYRYLWGIFLTRRPGGGYTSQVFFPKYETQQSIYPKIIQEFTEATAAWILPERIETADILYAGM